MNNKYDLKINKRYIEILLLIILLGLVYIILNYIGIFNLIIKSFKAVLPVFIAIIISFLFEPLINFFERKKIKRNISVFLVYGLILLVILLVLVLFIQHLFIQIKQFLSNLPSII